MSDTREKLIELITWVEDQLFKAYPYTTDVFRIEQTVDHLIANGVTVQKWIPVSERLPETEDVFLCWSKDLADMMFCYTSDFKQLEVTHWMPLPEPPEE